MKAITTTGVTVGRKKSWLGRAVWAPVLAALLLLAGMPQASAADSFYDYQGAASLATIKPGTVLRVRTVQAHLGPIPLPYDAVQILYRSTDMLGNPTTNVTSVLKARNRPASQKVIAYGSFYDSLNPRDQPSLALAGRGNTQLGGGIANVETLLTLGYVNQGYTVVVTDTEGQTANFAAGPEYGRNTLDALRAVLGAKQTGLTNKAKFALVGYSGGAIATSWAAELAPTYAPDIQPKLIGASMGGVLVHPGHNLAYVDGSLIWAGVMPMAVVGVARAFKMDLTPYLSKRGLSVFRQLERASIIDILRFPGVTWKSLAKPQYAKPEMVPEFVRSVNQLILGKGTPAIPLMIYQGAGGVAEGTPVNKQYGAGDGVMVAGDVRELARTYCGRGVPVEYRQFNSLSHVGTAPKWIDATAKWLKDRFAGVAATSNCGSVAAGNSLAAVKLLPAAK